MNASGILEPRSPSSSIEKGADVALRVGRVRKLGAAWGAADETPSIMGSGTEPSAPSSVSDPGTAGSRITSAATGAPLATASATARASRANAARRRRISALPPSKIGNCRWRQPPRGQGASEARRADVAQGRDLPRSVRVAISFILYASRTLYMRCDRRRFKLQVQHAGTRWSHRCGTRYARNHAASSEPIIRQFTAGSMGLANISRAREIVPSSPSELAPRATWAL